MTDLALLMKSEDAGPRYNRRHLQMVSDREAGWRLKAATEYRLYMARKYGELPYKVRMAIGLPLLTALLAKVGTRGNTRRAREREIERIKSQMPAKRPLCSILVGSQSDPNAQLGS